MWLPRGQSIFAVTVAIIVAVASNTYNGRNNRWMKTTSNIPSNSNIYDILTITGGASKKSKKSGSSKKSREKKRIVKEEDIIASDVDISSKVTSEKIDDFKDIAKENITEAILQKRSASSLIVDDSSIDDHSTVSLNPLKMEELGLLSGEAVLLKGKKRKTTVAIVNSDENVDFVRIQTTKVIRSNLR